MKTMMMWLFALLTIAAPAVAQQRTFVSAAAGNDLNPCTLASPCRNLQRGVDAVVAGGEVIPLDSGGYGTLVIQKSVTISAPSGVYAGVTAMSGRAIEIAMPNLEVTIRGLSINGLGADYGILNVQPSVGLLVENALLSSFLYAGIHDSGGFGSLYVNDTAIRNCQHNAIIGYGGSGDPFHGTMRGLRLYGNGGNNHGALVAGAGAELTVRDSIASGNFRGFEADDLGKLTLENCTSTHNSVGVFAGGFAQTNKATVRVSNSVIAYNTLYGIEAQAGSAVLSRGNNTVADNAAAETFSGTYAAK